MSVLVHNLPAGSAVWARENNVPYGWQLTDFLLTDVYHALTGQAHPQRPRANRASESTGPSRIERLRAQRERLTRQGINTIEEGVRRG